MRICCFSLLVQVNLNKKATDLSLNKIMQPENNLVILHPFRLLRKAETEHKYKNLFPKRESHLSKHLNTLQGLFKGAPELVS